MLTSDPLDALIASDAWGTRIVLEKCRDLSHEQFHREFPMGLGSLHETLTHVISVMRRWTDRLAGRPPRPMLHKVKKYPHLSGDAKDRTPDELLALLDEARRDLVAVAAQARASTSASLASTLSLDWPGDDGVAKTYTFTRAVVFVHLCTHGYHHRAQCLNMLRHLNVPGLSDHLPEPSAVDWQTAAESPAVVKTPVRGAP